MSNKFQNTQGKVFYGLHFYPGLAEYTEAGQDSYRIYLNENTLRQMDATFAGKPIFVEHVDEVDPSLNKLRSEADGWVIESFFNDSDGKHWVKFIVVSDEGLRAVESGMRLSNAYKPLTRSKGGLWNGVPYQEEITSGEYEHLAIVKHPRYEESVIMTPEEFKQYNEDHKIQLRKLANSKDQPTGEKKMAFKFFKRAKIENTLDIESTSVELPKSKKEYLISDLITKMDTIENMAGYADPDHMVKCNGEEMSVKDLVSKHEAAMNEMNAMKEPKSEEMPKEEMNSEASVAEDMKTTGDRGGEEEGMKVANKEEEMSDEDMKKKEVKKNEIKSKVASLKNAGPKLEVQPETIVLNSDKVALGKARYGSNK